VVISQKPQKRLYSIKEAAVYLSLSTWKVRGLTGEGALPYIHIGK
jgi:excisionase family DNA binding protein